MVQTCTTTMLQILFPNLICKQISELLQENVSTLLEALVHWNDSNLGGIVIVHSIRIFFNR
jgi:hypothetical protein